MEGRTAYLMRRLLWVPVILFFVTFVTFGLARFGPGDPVRVSRFEKTGTVRRIDRRRQQAAVTVGAVEWELALDELDLEALDVLDELTTAVDDATARLGDSRREQDRSARALDAVCVTDNVAEFKRVPVLKVENWLR